MAAPTHFRRSECRLQLDLPRRPCNADSLNAEFALTRASILQLLLQRRSPPPFSWRRSTPPWQLKRHCFRSRDQCTHGVGRPSTYRTGQAESLIGRGKKGFLHQHCFFPDHLAIQLFFAAPLGKQTKKSLTGNSSFPNLGGRPNKKQVIIMIIVRLAI